MPWPDQHEVIIVPLLPQGQRVITRMYLPAGRVQPSSVGTNGSIVYVAVPLGIQRLSGFRVEVEYQVSDLPHIFVIYEQGRPPQFWEIIIGMKLKSQTFLLTHVGDEPMEPTAEITSVTQMTDGTVVVVLQVGYAGKEFEQTLVYQPTVQLALVNTIPQVQVPT